MPEPQRRPLRILFFLRAINFDRVFESFLRELLGRGHVVEVVLDTEKGGLPENATRLFDALVADHRNFAYELVPRRQDATLEVATALRLAIDYLRYLEPEYRDAVALRERAHRRVPKVLRLLLWPASSSLVRPAVSRLLRTIERAVPIQPEIRELLEQHVPDVVLASPVIGLGSAQADYLRAASAAGIPTVLPVASWDNLTNKGVLRVVPTCTIVWNDAQVEEAVSLHGLPRERVVAVGAHTWDHWFQWRPSTTRADFAARVGLREDLPFVLYVGSSWFIGGDEAAFVGEWIRRLRAVDNPRVRELGVLVRPHPQNRLDWAAHGVPDPGRVVVWPPSGAAPIDSRTKSDYYDSIHHSVAVVGLNTSAMMEPAILRTPVLSVVTDRYKGTQEGTLHFAHLAGVDGLLVVGRGWDEHFAQLAAIVAEPALHEPRIDAFLHAFVRPHGLDQPAAPLAADAVERAAALGPAELPATRTILQPALPLLAALLHPRRTLTRLARVFP